MGESELVDSLKSILMGIFTPQESVNFTSQRFLFFSPLESWFTDISFGSILPLGGYAQCHHQEKSVENQSVFYKNQLLHVMWISPKVTTTYFPPQKKIGPPQVSAYVQFKNQALHRHCGAQADRLVLCVGITKVLAIILFYRLCDVVFLFLFGF